MKNLRLLSTLVGLLVFCASVRAENPSAEVKTTADKIIALLNDSALKGNAKKTERRQLMRQQLDQLFDWTGIARSSLGRHWAKRTPEEQKQFVALFSEFLQRTYLDKFEAYYTELDRIDYQGEKIIGEYASVKSTVTTKQKMEHPVEYRLQKTPSGNGWLAYDVLIEGVSLVRNYRAQFDEIVAKSSYEKLVEDLRKKLAAD